MGHSAPLPPLQGPRATHGWLRLSFVNLGPLPCPTMAAFYSCFPVGATVQGLGRYVVREPGRKFSLPAAPPLLPPCHPPASRVAVCWGSWWKGRDGRRREGSFGLNSCCISLAPAGFPAWTPVGQDGLARQSSPGAGELGAGLVAVLVSPVQPCRGRASSTMQRERG